MLIEGSLAPSDELIKAQARLDGISHFSNQQRFYAFNNNMLESSAVEVKHLDELKEFRNNNCNGKESQTQQKTLLN